MERVKLVVKERSERGTRGAKRLRRGGSVPGVLYGAGKQALAFSVDEHSLREATTTAAGLHAVLDVVFEGRKRAHVAVIKDMQLDRVKHTVIHLDLHEIHLNEPIETKVSVHLDGSARGIKAGGMLDIVTHEVTVRGLPADIPEHLSMDITDVDLGQVVRVKDLALPRSLAVLDDPEETLFVIESPRGLTVEEEAAAAEEAAEAAAEPELVGKGKEEEGAE